ncbi:MAG TPA: tripartite tricarboxylate transporter substrate binding protein [Falsiroseomonas sp.]|nr:tripartite tricarboxylate transporter substrate binding protein [Falsiroseomonas sp.]
MDIRTARPPRMSAISRRTLLGAAALGALPLPAHRALAQDWPTRPVRMIVPFVPGGGADLNARLVAEPLGQELGQSIVVENRGGAGGTIGATAVAQAPADGYTMLYGTPGPLITNPFLMASMPYDAARDFAPVSLLTKGAYVMTVHRDLPVRNVAELIALAKQKPGELTFASSGIGAGSHLSGELLSMMADIRLSHVPYRGTGPALQDVAAGRVSISIDSYGPMIPLLQAGSLRPIAVTSRERMAELPDVPPVAETVPGYEMTVVNYIVVRAGTPRPIIDRLNAALVKVLADPALIERMRAAGASPPQSSTPEELGELLRSEAAKLGEVIRRAGIQAR